MSVLIEAANRILSWLMVNKNSYALALQAGLSYSEIQEKTKNLPFKLPMEVIELYQWRNGTKDSEQYTARFFPAFTFNSLDQALIHYKELIDFSEESGQISKYDPVTNDSWEETIDPSEIYNPMWFPIFTFKNQWHSYLAIGGENEDATSVILDFSIEDSTPYPKYESLTKMLLTIAECYEVGAYYSGEISIRSNSDQAKSIRVKYNPTLEDLY